MGGNLKEIRRKIGSVQNTQKTTRAMKLVSASKLKKAEEVAKQARVFATKLSEVFEEIVQRVANVGFENLNIPIFQASKQREVKVVDIIFITAEKGLCGAFNQSVIKEVMTLIKHYQNKNIKVRLRGIGKKGISFFQFNHIPIFDEAKDLSSTPDYKKAVEFLKKSVDDFIRGETDEVLMIHNGFKSVISQEVKIKKILPFIAHKDIQGKEYSVLSADVEDEQEQILQDLSEQYLNYNLYYALLDSLVAEHSARVQAMEAATSNAGNLVRSLTISYNKARQEAITTELVEINAGVEAMK
ncbi:F0F1 ATP synthase subunit gamma [Helicobacter cholecystus]|uniref:ATP synthase gamma chain n=1 Tax=Helicobacter cholecystus TaxID=45498 RepID=A0A3D8IUP5_9HELI|nr:ATP synthase F1 subunit gamma [Helicobacter cholecystus]RDU68723.1 F0F1 ATP synthase subunit gamma [Helicobacter cholecystus]VEJ26203.1 F0F1 ATP synthase subunit gamma [Helicobacter cholecystus]